MKKFNQWLFENSKSEILQFAPNKKYFTISPEWGSFSNPHHPVVSNPSAAELKMMADVITSHGFPTKVAKTGGQWVYEDRPNFRVPDDIALKWDEAVDAAVEFLEKYREVVKEKRHKYHHDGKEAMPFYNREINDKVDEMRSIKNYPHLVKKIFDGLDNVTRNVLVHDAGLFKADGTLANPGMLRTY